MPDDDLAKVAPEVTTLARPSADYLLQARADVQASDEFKALFAEAREQRHTSEWLADNLAIRLSASWGAEHFHDALEAARYLADEFEQLGEGIHLVSTTTGRVLACIDEDDVWYPAPVPRESGGMAQPLPRIRPDLEGFITQWHFETNRERRITALLGERGHQTALLREEGDPRLLTATRAGRKAIVAGLTENDPKELLSQAGGTTGAFLRHFDLMSEDPVDPGPLTALTQAQAISRSTMGIQDPTTHNLHYNRAANLRVLLPQGWVREIARHLSLEARRKFQPEALHLDMLREGVLDAEMWVASPETLREIRQRIIQPVMPVEGAATMGLQGKVGALVIGGFQTGSHEMFDRWEVAAPLEYRLWVDWTKVKALKITGVAPYTEVVEGLF